jgi:hypothetical protein
MFLRLAVEAAEPPHPAHSYLTRRYRRLQDTFTDVFHALDESGLLRRSADPAHLARVTIALMDGLQVSARYDPTRDGIASDVEAQFAAVLNAEGRRQLASCLERCGRGASQTTD